MREIIYQSEFKSGDRNPNVNGDGRIITVTKLDANKVEILIQGDEGSGLNARLRDVSREVVDTTVWNSHKDLIINSATRGNV